MELKRELNLLGVKCPLPIVELNRMMKGMTNGEEVQVTADDPAFQLDVEAWCRRTGQSLLTLQQHDGKCVVVLRKTT